MDAPGAAATSADYKLMLRELPYGRVRFVSEFSPLSKFIDLKIYDKTPDATQARALPLNELLALAFNELAVEAHSTHEDDCGTNTEDSGHGAGARRAGFFQHLPNRDMASKVAERCKTPKAGFVSQRPHPLNELLTNIGRLFQHSYS